MYKKINPKTYDWLIDKINNHDTFIYSYFVFYKNTYSNFLKKEIDTKQFYTEYLEYCRSHCKGNFDLYLKCKYYDCARLLELLYSCMELYRVKVDPTSNISIVNAKEATQACTVLNAFSVDSTRNAQVITNISNLKVKRNLITHSYCNHEEKQLVSTLEFIYYLYKTLNSFDKEIVYMINNSSFINPSTVFNKPREVASLCH